MKSAVELVRERYREDHYTPKTSDYTLVEVNDGYVFDENLTIKQNKKMIEDWNSKVRAERKRFTNDLRDLEEKLMYDLGEALNTDYKIHPELGVKVVRMAYGRYHSNMEGFFEELEFLADVVTTALNNGGVKA